MALENAKITYYNGPKEYGKCQEGFEKHIGAENVEKLEKITDAYVAKVNELLEKSEKVAGTITLDFKIISEDK